MIKLRATAILCALASGCARRYPVEGLVLAVNPAQKEFTVSHRQIEGFMPAMVMPFSASPVALESLHPGSRVTFQLSVSKHGSKASHIKLANTGIEGIKLEDGELLQLPEAKGKVALDQPMPDFTLLDQSGQPISVSSFRGKTVVVNFIYTRCPLPDVCPRLSAGFAYLQRKFTGQMGNSLVLLSITLDPVYDTVETLSGYAKNWRADRSGWHMLTGTTAQIAEVAGRFGLVYWAEEDGIVHASVTAIISPGGRLVARIEGSRYPVTQLADLVRHELEKNK